MIQVEAKIDQYEAFDPVQGCERVAYAPYIEIRKDNTDKNFWGPVTSVIQVTSVRECDILILMLQEAKKELWCK